MSAANVWATVQPGPVYCAVESVFAGENNVLHKEPLFRSAWLWLLQLTTVAVLANGFGVSERLLNRVQAEYGVEARSRVEAWDRLMQDSENISVDEKLRQVNDFFNALDFVSDQALWGESDYWATPVEMLSRAAGDCEDFSVAKYFTLRNLGVPMEKLRLIYVKALKLKQAHMVLAYYTTPDAEPLVLDNVVKAIRPASLRKDLLPVYSFNGDGLWLAKQRGKGQRVSGSGRLHQWTKLTGRMQTFNADMAMQGKR